MSCTPCCWLVQKGGPGGGRGEGVREDCPGCVLQMRFLSLEKNSERCLGLGLTSLVTGSWKPQILPLPFSQVSALTTRLQGYHLVLLFGTMNCVPAHLFLMVKQLQEGLKESAPNLAKHSLQFGGQGMPRGGGNCGD